MKFDFDDILLIPEIISKINSRKEINPYTKTKMLPIMTAPMDTVIDISNFTEFHKNKIYSILPRGKDGIIQGINCWNSYGLKEFKERFIDKDFYYPNEEKKTTQYVLIDIANGHMSDLYNTAKIAKEQYGNLLVLMIGNVANPKTFLEYCKIGVDYIRCGIGSGSACTTSANVAIGYPMASLINECYLIKKEGNFDTKIVADGGFKNYSDIIKGLALGADRIMLGSMLNKCLESSGKNYVCNDKQDNYCEYSKTGFDIKALLPLMKQGKIYKKYRGMSTKEVQKDWGKEIIKTAEGISKFNKVEYTLAGFIENLEDYLRSAMSYTGSLTLEDFKGTNFELITQASFNRFNK